MYTIKKEFHFSASHILHGLPDDHPCSRLHGHNYIVLVELRDKELNEVGFVKDYRELQSVKVYIDTALDHRHLNNVWPDMNPSAENIAKVLFDLFKTELSQLYAIEVKETEKTIARYERSDFES